MDIANKVLVCVGISEAQSAAPRCFSTRDPIVQGKYLSLGVLRTRRDWQTGIVVIVISSVSILAYIMWASVSEKRQDALRRAAERDLGVAGQ